MSQTPSSPNASEISTTNFDDTSRSLSSSQPRDETVLTQPTTKSATQAVLAKNLVRTLCWIYAGIAFLLLFDKVVMIVFNITYLSQENPPTELYFQDNSKDLITLVLSTSSALAGSAIGFYFSNGNFDSEE